MTKHFTTDAERNEFYIKTADKNATKELRYIDGVLCIDGVPTDNQNLIDSQEGYFEAMSNMKELYSTPEATKKISFKQKVAFAKSYLKDFTLYEGEADVDLNRKSERAGFIVGALFESDKTDIVIGSDSFGCGAGKHAIAIYNKDEFGDGCGLYIDIRTQLGLEQLLEIAVELNEKVVA